MRSFTTLTFIAAALSVVSAGSAQSSHRKDNVAPRTPRIIGPKWTTSTRPVYVFSSSDQRTAPRRLRYVCAFDRGHLRRCPRRYSRRLRVGKHRLRARAIDRAGNRSRLASIKIRVGGGPAHPPPGPRPPPSPPGYGAYLPARLSPSLGEAHYVSTAGSDLNDGSITRPWRTVQKALDTLTAGQTAYVRAGTYSQNLVMTRAGSPLAPITIRNYPGGRVILQPGTGQEDNYPLQLQEGAAYLRFQGLVFEGATGPSTTNVYASGSAHDIELSDCEVRNSQRQGFFSERTTASIQIIGCFFHDNGGTGPPINDHNIYIEGYHHLIADSLITNAPNGFGVQIYPSNDGIIVTENTIIGASAGGIVVGSGGVTTTNNAMIVDNIVAFNTGWGIGTFWGGYVGTGNIATNNVAWGNAGGDLVGEGITYVGNKIADPRFADRANGNFHVQPGSPAIDSAQIGYALA